MVLKKDRSVEESELARGELSWRGPLGLSSGCGGWPPGRGCPQPRLASWGSDPPTLEPRLGRGRLGFRPSSTHFRLQAAHSPDLGSRSPPLPLPESAVARSASHLNPDAAAASAHAPPTRGPAGLPLPPLPRPHSPPAPINGRLAARPIAFPATTNPAPGCP